MGIQFKTLASHSHSNMVSKFQWGTGVVIDFVGGPSMISTSESSPAQRVFLGGMAIPKWETTSCCVTDGVVPWYRKSTITMIGWPSSRHVSCRSWTCQNMVQLQAALPLFGPAEVWARVRVLVVNLLGQNQPHIIEIPMDNFNRFQWNNKENKYQVPVVFEKWSVILH